VLLNRSRLIAAARTGDAFVREFEVAAEVERTRLMALVDQRRDADVAASSSRAAGIQQVRHVRRTADDAVRRRHAAAGAHPPVLGLRDDEHLIATCAAQTHHLALAVRRHAAACCTQ